MSGDKTMELYEKKDKKEISNQSTNEETTITEGKLNKKKNKTLIISFVFITIMLIILFCCIIFSLLKTNNTKKIKGVSINKINIQELTKEEAKELIKEEAEKELNKDINIKLDEFEYSIKLNQIELEYKIDEAVENAYKVGRSGNIFTNNFSILNSIIKGKDITLEYSYNDELINSITKDISAKIPGAVEESSYYIEENKLCVRK